MGLDLAAALAYPFTAGLLQRPGGPTLLLNAMPDIAAAAPDEVLAQTYDRAAFRALTAAGYDTIITPIGMFDTVIVPVPRQREEALAFLATGIQALKPGGLLLAAAANDEGGKRLARDAESLGLHVNKAAKHHCTIIWSQIPESANKDALGAALKDGDFQPVLDNTFVSRPGLFSWDRIDPASAMLAETLPSFAGRGADFGCGYGYLTAALLGKGATVTAIDADWRAVEACRRNFGDRAECLWANIANPKEGLPENLDWIVSNPPFHAGNRTAVPALGQAFIARAAKSLKEGGALWLVANAHLPYEAALKNLFTRVEKMREDASYKIYKTIR